MIAKSYAPSIVFVLLMLICRVVNAESAPITIDWSMLTPVADDKLSKPTVREHTNMEVTTLEDLGSEMADALSEAAEYQEADYAVVESLNGERIRIPGFVVPIEYNSNNEATEIFVAPFLGACIHVPPPPPNQLIYAELAKPSTELEDIYTPRWITGILHTNAASNELADAAYRMKIETIEPYQE